MCTTRQSLRRRGMSNALGIAACVVGIAVATPAYAGGPPNDECSNATAISGDGSFTFDTTGATTGAEGQECNDGGTIGIENDVWFCWTATCSGIVTIQTCSFTSLDTKIALYDGCACPLQPGMVPLCCNDNSCGEQSEIICDVVCGKQYLIQIGQPPNGLPGGTGGFRIICQGDPCDEPCCIDFDDNTTNGFAPCSFAPNIIVSTASPGPSGNANDFYLRLQDTSNASLACGTACTGDWTEIAADPCGALCFDFRLFEDGCVSSIPDCAANGGWIPIYPRIIISNGTVSATFVGSTFVTDANGPNPGWISVCAPIGPLDSSGNLPNNEDGAWVMGGGAPNSDWTTLISNVTEMRLPIDFTGNPAEIAGYDNICLTTDVCPCMVIEEEEILCDLGADGQPTGTYTLNFNVTNFSGTDAYYVLIPDSNVSPNVIPLGSALPGDGSSSQNFSVTVTGATPGDVYCFDILLADINIEECCSSELCIEIPECDCMLLTNVDVQCAQDGTGAVTLSFDLTNLTPDVVEHMFLVPQPIGTPVTIDPDYVDVPTMNPFTSQSFGVFTINGATAGEVICIRISIHDENLGECCSQDLCFTVPDCSTAFSPCDLNFSGAVDVFDLLIVLDSWGDLCPPNCDGDANNDGVVDIFDLLLVLSNWSV